MMRDLSRNTGISSTVSTTTTANVKVTRLRGFGVDLLDLLSKDVISIFELSEITDKPLRYLSVYLSRLKKYGLIDGDGAYWTLNDEGLWILSLLSSRKKKNKILSRRLETPPLIKSRRTENYTRNSKHGTLGNSSQHLATVDNIGTRQLTLEKAVQRFNLNDCEKEVVEVLLAHYNRTGSPFIYVDYIEDLRLTYEGAVLQHAIQKLKQDNIIYIWQDRAVKALKLGLKKAFLEKLATEETL